MRRRALHLSSSFRSSILSPAVENLGSVFWLVVYSVIMIVPMLMLVRVVTVLVNFLEFDFGHNLESTLSDACFKVTFIGSPHGFHQSSEPFKVRSPT